LNAFAQAGAHYLLRADWGCKQGVHKAWIVVEAENDADARMVVPPIFRGEALVVKLNEFTTEEIRAMHMQASGGTPAAEAPSQPAVKEQQGLLGRLWGRRR
jgi:hypothetical protein